MVISASSVTTEKKEKLQMQEVIEEFSTEMILGRYLSSLITERSILLKIYEICNTAINSWVQEIKYVPVLGHCDILTTRVARWIRSGE
ncbi:7979_t:CDS:2 [Rhizophagus irregularis]|nr:7979_t:CDS:2 [Rhizophagus irregularis]